MATNFRQHFSWLNELLFETILRRDRQNDAIRVTDLVINPALADGENYSSQMLRVSVRFNDGCLDAAKSYVFKAMLIDGLAREIAEMRHFHKEICNYEQILPAVEALLRSIGDATVLSARLVASSEELMYLVFEDLSVRGYANLDRKTGFHAKDFRKVFNKVAKWHACTAVILEKTPSLLTSYANCTFDIQNPMWHSMIVNFSITLADVCQRIPELQHLAAKFRSGQATIVDRFHSAVARNPTGFNVLTHGDLWSNNIMFRRDPTTTAIQDALFVDFQLSWITSPMVDLVYSLFSSSHADLNEIDWEQLIQFYHTELTSLLDHLGFKGRRPRLTELQAEMLTRGTFGMIFGILVHVMRTASNAVELQRMFSGTAEDREFRQELLLGDEYRKALVFLLQYCDRKGLLDNGVE